MRCLFLVAIVSGALSAQSMVEFGAVAAGSAVGGVAGKRVSEGITSTFSRTGGILNKASKTDEKSKVPIPPAASSSRVPTLQVSPGVPKSSGGGKRAAVSEPNNVPLPPPAPVRRVKASSRPTPIRVALVAPQPPVRVPLDVDLNALVPGMPRADVLALGDPSARITMFEDGHLVEIYNYRNETLVSGSLRLIDGAVAAIQLHP